MLAPRSAKPSMSFASSGRGPSLWKLAASVACGLAVVVVASGATRAAGAQAAKRYTVPALVTAMSPAVVFIGNINRSGQVASIGSGFVVDPTGMIVTNYHVIEGAHAHDLATLLDLDGVAVRSGQHCAHPLLQFYGVAATLRASFAFYNTHEEVEHFVAALKKARQLLA